MAFLIRKIFLVTLLPLLMISFQSSAYGDMDISLHEQEIKAGLLYNFLKYIDWPPDSTTANSSRVTICVFGDDPFNEYLKPMEGRSVNQQGIALVTVHTIHEVSKCRLLFVNSSQKEQWPQIIKYTTGKNILTVSDFENFADSGGMIEFGRKDEHISVYLNMGAVTTAHMHVQERLLKLVTIVHPPTEGG